MNMILIMKDKKQKTVFTTAWLLASKVAHLNTALTTGPRYEPKPATIGGRKVAVHYKKKSAALDWIGWNLLAWSAEQAQVLEEEYMFHVERKWRFDWALPGMMIAIEFEGGIFQEKSGHNTAKHYTKDAEKYNAAAALGWRVVRLTALNYKTLHQHLNFIIKNSAKNGTNT
jgi:hypothetical protein